ncbi:hypothetical protein M407DRAFT_22840 [Tulasnella calospora MUT 4182]|uniref:Uncharacterized protein n=1 Tax=Tulasnella calospora MUT 4182 TaxID=1051891 RepID=A0A0C3M2K3_9AGAM|nr:hypothetical protein M407DRAFT_22840 [Tulasnella calospora MUT 4182]
MSSSHSRVAPSLVIPKDTRSSAGGSASSPVDSFPVLSPHTETGWVAGFFDLLSRNTGLYSPASAESKSKMHSAKKHGAMGLFD